MYEKTLFRRICFGCETVFVYNFCGIEGKDKRINDGNESFD
jgi:hypothetical protein